MVSLFIKLTCALLLATSGLLVYADPRVAIELFTSGASLLLLVVLSSRYIRSGLPVRLSLEPDLIFYALFAYVSTVQALTHVVDTDIPRYRLLLRAIYYLYLIFLTTPYARGLPRYLFGILSIVIFTSFPYHWMYVFGHIGSVLVFLAALYAWFLYERDGKRDMELPLSLVVVFAAMMAALISSTVYHGLFPKGVNHLLMFGVGAILFLIVYGERENPEAVRSIFSILLISAIMHSLFFYSGVLSNFFAKEKFNIIFDKINFIAGVNANDISGYIITAIPILLAFVAWKGKGRRAIPILFLAINLMLLWIVKSRFAWPVAVIEIGFYYTILYKKKLFSKIVIQRMVLAALIGLALSILLYAIYPERVRALTNTSTFWSRFELWRLAVDTIEEYPLLGAGPENNAVLASREIVNSDPDSYPLIISQFTSGGTYLHSHNIFLQMWLNGGALFLAGFCYLTLAAFKGFMAGEKAAMRVASATVLLAIIIEGLMNYHFMDYPVWIAFIISVSLLIRAPEAGRSVRVGGTSRILAIPLIAILTYHSTAVYFHSEAIRYLKPYRHANAFGDLVLKNGALEADRKFLREGYGVIANSLRIATLMVPWSVGLHAETGELEYFAYKINGDAGSLQRAQSEFKKCLAMRPNGPFCSRRLHDIGFAGDPHGTGYREYLLHSQKHDPFRLLDRKEIVPF